MNIKYLDTLQEVENKYKIELKDNEKVVFVANLPTFGTEKDSMLGENSKFTLTNKRIVIDNGAGIWTIDISQDIATCTKVESKFLFFKTVYFSLVLNAEVEFDYGKQKLNGYHFYFDEDETTKFEEIVNKLFN